MGTTTTRAGLPYPLGTDRVMDGDDAIANLAKRLDGSDNAGPQSVPFAMAAGEASFAFAGGVQVIVAVTFPTGRFTQSPRLVTGFVSAPGSAAVPYLRTSGAPVPTTGFSFVANTSTAYTGTIIADWTAIQMTSASGSG